MCEPTVSRNQRLVVPHIHHVRFRLGTQPQRHVPAKPGERTHAHIADGTPRRRNWNRRRDVDR